MLLWSLVAILFSIAACSPHDSTIDSTYVDTFQLVPPEILRALLSQRYEVPYQGPIDCSQVALDHTFVQFPIAYGAFGRPEVTAQLVCTEEGESGTTLVLDIIVAGNRELFIELVDELSNELNFHVNLMTLDYWDPAHDKIAMISGKSSSGNVLDRDLNLFLFDLSVVDIVKDPDYRLERTVEDAIRVRFTE